MAAQEIITTARLRLSPLEDGDLGALMRLFSDARHMWDLLDIPGRSNDAEALAAFYLERSRWGWRRHGAGLWGMRPLARPEAAIVGYAGFVMEPGREIDPRTELEAGWAVAPEHTGRGYALEAAGAVLGEAFHGLGAERVAAITSPDNAPSRHLMERLGMRHVKDVTAYQGLQVCYAVDRAAWLARR